MISSIIQALFKIKIQPNMSEQENKRQRIYDLLNAVRKRRSRILNKKRKEGFLTFLTSVIKKDPTASIRKHANELKIHEKTVRIANKQDLNPDFNPLDFAIWSILENKTNATYRLNIGSLKTAIEKEWNKMSKKCLLKAYKSFQRRVDTITGKKKNYGHIE